MGMVIAALILLAGGISLVGILYRLSRGRRALEKHRRAAATEKRMLQELELLERIEGIKNPDERAMARRAIEKDPERAARVVSKLMKGGGGHGDG